MKGLVLIYIQFSLGQVEYLDIYTFKWMVSKWPYSTFDFVINSLLLPATTVYLIRYIYLKAWVTCYFNNSDLFRKISNKILYFVKNCVKTATMLNHCAALVSNVKQLRHIELSFNIELDLHFIKCVVFHYKTILFMFYSQCLLSLYNIPRLANMLAYPKHLYNNQIFLRSFSPYISIFSHNAAGWRGVLCQHCDWHGGESRRVQSQRLPGHRAGVQPESHWR